MVCIQNINMQIIEFVKQQNEKFTFYQEGEVWVLKFKNKEKQKQADEFFINLLQDLKLRSIYKYVPVFNESEVSAFMAYLKKQGFTIRCRDTELEEKLKHALVIITKNNPQDISDLVNEMTYHDQLLIADKIAKA